MIKDKYALYFMDERTGINYPCSINNFQRYANCICLGMPDSAPHIWTRAGDIRRMKQFYANVVDRATQGSVVLKVRVDDDTVLELATKDDPRVEEFRIVPIELRPNFTNSQSLEKQKKSKR